MTDPLPTVLRKGRLLAAASRWPLLAAALATLQGCVIATPMQRLTADGPPVTVVVTYGRLHSEQRAAFNQQTSMVLRTLPQQPGLLAYSARRELLGNQVWTLTVWQDPASLSRFLAGQAHRQAVSTSLPALQDMRSTRLQMARADVPRDWPAVLELLRTAPTRPYWE